ncbi:hypothetical protein JZL99_22790 [Escherichia coli]|uniref:hypothetical protein n=1 Tax=Escherichia coli TaxID=562 RepID=UPI0019D14868|nr:hypothetical protein [Escherichia coli]MBN6416922.1 hypothetical protein [Escherichia coli]
MLRKTILCFFVFFASGCHFPGTSDSLQKVKIPSVDMNETNEKFLSTCLFEAGQLEKINPDKYKDKVNLLQAALKKQKYYNSIEGQVNDSTQKTLTPLYIFYIRDVCGDINYALGMELKQKLLSD